MTRDRGMRRVWSVMTPEVWRTSISIKSSAPESVSRRLTLLTSTARFSGPSSPYSSRYNRRPSRLASCSRMVFQRPLAGCQPLRCRSEQTQTSVRPASLVVMNSAADCSVDDRSAAVAVDEVSESSASDVASVSSMCRPVAVSNSTVRAFRPRSRNSPDTFSRAVSRRDRPLCGSCSSMLAERSRMMTVNSGAPPPARPSQPPDIGRLIASNRPATASIRAIRISTYRSFAMPRTIRFACSRNIVAAHCTVLCRFWLIRWITIGNRISGRA